MTEKEKQELEVRRKEEAIKNFRGALKNNL